MCFELLFAPGVRIKGLFAPQKSYENLTRGCSIHWLPSRFYLMSVSSVSAISTFSFSVHTPPSKNEQAGQEPAADVIAQSQATLGQHLVLGT